MHLEEGYPASLITSEMGSTGETLHQWVKWYQQYGEAGLQNQRRGSKRSRLSGRVKNKIIALKRSNPGFGSRCIADMLKRLFLLPASTSTVHTTLSQEELITPPKQKPKTNPGAPRFSSAPRPTSSGRAIYVPSGWGDDRMPTSWGHGRLFPVHDRGRFIPKPDS
jgi:transposase